MVTSGVELFRRVKVMEQDLFSFILIRHFSNQVCRVLKYKYISSRHMPGLTTYVFQGFAVRSKKMLGQQVSIIASYLL
jgi:hypothetical protein